MHFWSLAIEEQFYIVFPILMAVLLTVRMRRWVGTSGARHPRRGVRGVDARDSRPRPRVLRHPHPCGRIPAGALLVFALSSGALDRFGARRRRAITAAGWLSAVSVTLVLTVHQSSAWLYAGGFSALGLLRAAPIVAAIQPGSFRRVLGFVALVWIGRLSYGLYLIHWPVFLALDSERVGLDGPVPSGIRLAVSLGLTIVAYHLVEQPIRARRLLGRTPSASMAYGLMAVGLITASILLVRPPGDATTAAMVPDGIVDFSASAEPLPAIEPKPTGDEADSDRAGPARRLLRHLRFERWSSAATPTSPSIDDHVGRPTGSDRRNGRGSPAGAR